jgi:hypothetical protein
MWLGLLACEVEALGQLSAQHYSSLIFFEIYLFVKYSRKLFKLSKFTQIHRKLRKIQNKLYENICRCKNLETLHAHLFTGPRLIQNSSLIFTKHDYSYKLILAKLSLNHWKYSML